MKISQKLIILLLLIALIPLSVIGVFAYTSIQGALSEQINTQLGNTLTRQTNKIDTLITQDLRLVDLLAVHVQARFLINDYYKTNSKETQANLNDLLGEIRLDNRSFRRIHILNPEGKIIGSSDERFVGKDYSKTKMFELGQRGADVSLFFKDVDGVLGHYLISRMSLEGNFLGIALVEAQADSYTLLTKDYTDTGDTGETFIAGKDENGKEVYFTPLRFKADAAMSPYVASTTSPPRDYRDLPVVLRSKEIPITRWTVGVKIDEAEIYAPVSKIRDLTLIVVLATAAAVLLLAMYLSRVFTAPLGVLTSKTQKIAQGDLSQVIDIKSTDEIGMLASSFNSMTTKLRELYQGLEQKVVERTKQLDQKVQELGDAKAKDDAILGSIGEGMIVTDSRGMMLLVNTIAAHLLDRPVSSLTGQPVTNLKLYDPNGEVLPAERTPLFTALKTNERAVQDVTSVFSDGSKLTLSITATPVIQNGQVIGVIQIVRDITKEKEVDRMKTEFISLASHQLRTPLSAIKWFAEMLIAGDAGKLNEEQQGFAQNIGDSTERMIELVSSLLNISRIESGRIIIDPKPTDLKKLVEELAVELKVKLDEKKQNFALSVHNELPLINVDPQLTRQVYLNLLTNAIKYTPEGGQVAVMISRNGEEMLSQVTDTGYGIPKAQQSKVFQKFFRAENVTKIITDGTGLGLYLIKAIVDSQQGKIWFESEEGKGTTFWFTLPVAGVQAKKGEVTIE